MKITRILVAVACTFFLHTAASAQATPASNSTPGGAMGSVNTQPQRGNGVRKDGTVERNADKNMQTGTMDSKSTMNSHKATKKTKTSTTGTM